MPGTCPGGGGKVGGMGGGPDAGAEDGVPRLKKFAWLFSSVGGGGRAETGRKKSNSQYFKKMGVFKVSLQQSLWFAKLFLTCS